MQHHVSIILESTESISSIKCHLQDNIYNTVIYCNNWRLKFHKKRNKTALPLPITKFDLPKTSEMSLPKLPTPHLVDGESDRFASQCHIPLGVSPFRESGLSFRVLFVSAILAGKNVFGVGCLYWSVSISGICKAGKVFVSVCDWLFWFARCVCVCVSSCMCVFLSLCAQAFVSASLTGV